MITLAPEPESHVHCTTNHHVGVLRDVAEHGPYAPKVDDTFSPMKNVWVCCHCGRYEDAGGEAVKAADVIFKTGVKR